MEKQVPEVAGSAPSQDVDNADYGGDRNPDGSVKFQTFDRLVGRLKKTIDLNEQLASQNKMYETERKQIEEAKLAESGEYQKLLDVRNNEVQTLSERLSQAEQEKQLANKTLIDAQKLQAVYEELPGRVINPEYMQWVDLDSVAYNPETGNVDRETAKLSANKFMERHGKLVDTSHIGKLPGDSASPSQSLTSTFRTLPLKEMRSNISNAVRQAKQELGV